MKLNRKPWTLKMKRWSPIVAGGMLLQLNLSGCDAEVRDAFLTGIQGALSGFQTTMSGLMTNIVSAVFMSFMSGESQTQITAQAIIDAARTWVA